MHPLYGLGINGIDLLIGAVMFALGYWIGVNDR